MSQRALALAVRDVLRQKLSLPEEQCDLVPPPGRPPAASGELFVAVWEGGFDNPDTDSRNDYHKVNVTITRRVPFAPYDREAREVIHAAVVGLEVMGDDVAAAVHNSSDVRLQANNYLSKVAGNRTVYGFSEPLRFMDGTRTEEKGGEWFSGDREDRVAGRALTLYFGKGRRLQSNQLQA